MLSTAQWNLSRGNNLKENFPPISILTSLFKIFEKSTFSLISSFSESIFGKYECGFQKVAIQKCFLAMLEKWKRTVEKSNVFAALLTIIIPQG